MAGKYPEKTHRRVFRKVSINGKTPEQVGAILMEKSKGLLEPKVYFENDYYAKSLEVRGYQEKTAEDLAEEQKAREQAKARKAREAKERRNREVMRKAQQAAACAAEQKATAEALARMLREAGYEVKKAPKEKK